MPFIAISTRFFDGLYSSFHKRVLKFDLAARLLTSIQHYSFLPVLSFGRFNLYAQSIGFLINNPTRNPYRWLEITGISVFWLWFGYGLLLNVIPTWPLRLFLLYLSHGATMILHLQITLSHFAMDTTDAPPHETFAELGVRTTMNGTFGLIAIIIIIILTHDIILHNQSTVLNGWIGFMGVCSFRLNIICFRVFRAVISAPWLR
jgi:delta8-fatty-acid desaturase